MQEGGAVLAQAVNELTRQGGGELEKLIRIEERSHCGVQTNKQETIERGHRFIVNYYITKHSGLVSQLNVP